jgi:hypothetical protein
VRIGRIAADVHDNRQFALLARGDDLIASDEGGDRRIEINAVDKDINVQDLRERAPLGSLGKVPFEDIVPRCDDRYPV